MLKKIMAVAAFGLVTQLAHSQSYPQGTVTLVVPYTAGGSVDTVGREMGSMLGEQLKQTFIIENRPGASANIGAAHVARAKPDGHTLFVSAATTLAAAPSLFKNLPYDPLKDLKPVALITAQPNILVVHPSIRATSVDELIALAKDDPQGLNLGIVSQGGPHHMSAELFMQMTDTELTIVPYKGGSEAVMDLLGGRLDVMFAPFPEVIQYVKAQEMRALAVTTKERTELLPDVPSLNELGLEGYEMVGWMALAAPAGTPDDVIATLNEATEKALQDPGLKQRLSDFGLVPLGGSLDEVNAYRDSEVEKYRHLIEVSGMQPL